MALVSPLFFPHTVDTLWRHRQAARLPVPASRLYSA
jgi:hypothetical protein